MARVSRRLLLGSGAAALAGPPLVERVGAQSAFDWRRFKGEKIEVSLLRAPSSELLQRHQKEFEELTGITVGSEQVPEQQHRQKQVIEFASGRPSFDVTTVSWHVQKRLFARGQWLEDLRPFLADATLTAPEFDLADISPAGIAAARQPDGRLDTLPFVLHYFILYWNKELFAAKGLTAPKTFAELNAAARALTDRQAGTYGYVGRGLKNANVVSWTVLLLGWDQDTVSPDQKLLTDTDAAIEAARLFQTLGRDYGPPGLVGFNWSEALTSFSQGKVGIWLDNANWAATLEDPTKSRVAGKVGYAVVPAGPKAHHTALFGDGIGVAAASRKKGAAYLYAQWATGKAAQTRALVAGAHAPPRASAFASDQVRNGLTLPAEWLRAAQDSVPLARLALPEIVPVTEFRDVFGIALANVLGGADPAAELRKATEQFQPILEKSERA